MDNNEGDTLCGDLLRDLTHYSGTPKCKHSEIRASCLLCFVILYILKWTPKTVCIWGFHCIIVEPLNKGHFGTSHFVLY